MKKLKLTGIALLFLGFNVFAQSNETPRKAQASFGKMFPAAKEVKWSKENANEWEAEFTMNGKAYSANFSTDGTWIETEHEISEKEIPTAVKNTLAKDYADYKVAESEFSETKDGALFEFELKKGNTETEISIDRSGKIVKKEAESEDKD